MSALYHLQVLYSQSISPEDRKHVKALIEKARIDLAKQYGTAIDYTVTSHSEPDAIMIKSTKEQVAGRNSSTIFQALSLKYPIAKIADEAAARFRVTIQQTRNDFTSSLSNQLVEERKYLIEDPNIRAAREKAAADAAWAKFQSVMANFDRTASHIERTARTNYEQRTRFEDTASGKELVWYEGRQNQGALNLSNPEVKYTEPPKGMIELTEKTQTSIYNNVVYASYSASLKDRNKVIDSLPSFSKSESWNFKCKTQIDHNGHKNSNCFGGANGSSGPLNEAVMKDIFAKWIQGHYENRVMAENIHRLQTASNSKNKPEVAEMILLGRSLGIASSKEQEAVLKDVFGEEKAFDRVLAVTTIQ